MIKSLRWTDKPDADRNCLMCRYSKVSYNTAGSPILKGFGQCGLDPDCTQFTWPEYRTCDNYSGKESEEQ